MPRSSLAVSEILGRDALPTRIYGWRGDALCSIQTAKICVEVVEMRVASVVLMLTMLAGISTLDNTISKSKPKSAAGAKDSAAIALAGEFRTVFANLLWIKADQYHHEFIAHNNDWEMNTDVIGLDRLITKLDPHFDEAYAAGARMLSGTGQLNEAVSFLEEGVTNNPNSRMLHEELGTLLARHKKDYERALLHLKRAYVLSDEDFDTKRLRRLIGTVREMAET